MPESTEGAPGTTAAASATAALARFAATLTYESVPEDTRAYCKVLLLDALACALAGDRGEETRDIERLATQLARSAESSVIGGERMSLAGATLLNGYLITAVTMCDVHRPTMTHVTPEVVPPALALAERDALSGRELLVALAAGFETTVRVGLGLNYAEFRRRGWHGPGIIGPFGAAAAAGRLLRLDTDAMARAFALAGSQAAGTFAAWGTPTVKFHQCRGALSGLMAALLAQTRFEATREFLTAPDGGLYNTYTDGGSPDAAVAELGTRWELHQIALRLWPCGSAIQGLVTAMFDLVEKHDVHPAQVSTIDIRLSAPAFRMHGHSREYSGKFEAMLSAHYAAAAILHDRALSLVQYEPARYDDPGVRRFAAGQVNVSVDAGLEGLEVLVRAHMADGSTIDSDCMKASGTPENPLSQSQVEAKFRHYADGRLSAADIERVVRMVAGLEDLASVGALTALLRGSR